MPHNKQAKTILNKHKKRDNWFLDEYSVNPYEGCSCNCQYCYIRGSKYGEQMDDGLAVKTNAVALLEKQLAPRAKKGQYGFVAVGTATDAYLHHEEKYRITRGLLEVLLRYRFPVFISTKCLLITRDIALLQEIDRQAVLPADLRDTLKRGVILSVSLSSLDEKVSAMLEPGAAPPLQRLELVRQLKQEGFLAGVNAMPLLPFISDTPEELEKIIAAAKAHDADYILTAGLTLFGEGPADSKTLFGKFLEKYDATLLPKYRQQFGENAYALYNYQRKLAEKTAQLCKKYSIRNSILH